MAQTQIVRETAVATATIASGAALSNAIDMRDFSFLAVHLPSAWTAACELSSV